MTRMIVNAARVVVGLAFGAAFLFGFPLALILAPIIWAAQKARDATLAEDTRK